MADCICQLSHLFLFDVYYVYVIILQQMTELCKNIRELKSILYGNSESEPVSEACAQLTQEFFKEDTLRLLIKCIPKLNLEVLRNFETNIFAVQ
jgi:hypothetical protein